MRYSLTTALFCTLSLAADARAQSAADSAQAIAAAIHVMVGTVPIEHPGGATRQVCIEAQRLGASVPISMAVLSQVREAVVAAGTLSLTERCRRVDAETHGGWVMDAHGAPAMNVRIDRAQLTGDRGEVRLTEQRGGRLGHSARCTVAKGASGQWAVEACSTTSAS
ncbi:MAG: hypothetical protein WEF86_01205 [Gemmatimonadota bacterium]